MKNIWFIIFGGMFVAPLAHAELSATEFPGTVEDMSFAARVENLIEGYKPFLNAKAYQELDIVPGEEIFTDHMIAVEEAAIEQQQHDAKTLPHHQYCEKYKSDTDSCPPVADTSDITPSGVTPSNVTTPYSGYTIGGGTVVENSTVIGGSCYPSDHDRVFINKILTTGKYERQYPAFEKGLMTVFRKEGGCGTIKNDPCGYTCYGIGSSSKCMGILVHSRAEAEDVYYKHFWYKYKIYKLPDVISADVFLASMASGPGSALKQFRKFLGLSPKISAVDDEMVNAVKNYKGDIHNKWLDVRDKFLQGVAQRRYGGALSRGYKNAIEIKRKNGCHVRPQKPLYR